MAQLRFKLDENLGSRTQHLFREAGHDVQTARDEALQGASDQRIYEASCVEGRCLVTLDLDFADVIRFPPSRLSGVVVIRVPRNPSLPLLERLVSDFLRMAEATWETGSLWIVEVGRIRIREADESDRS